MSPLRFRLRYLIILVIPTVAIRPGTIERFQFRPLGSRPGPIERSEMQGSRHRDAARKRPDHLRASKVQ